MRVHQNYVEDITLMSVISFIGGLHNAKVQLYFNLIYIVGRYFYGVGYVKSTSNGSGRMYGSLIMAVGKVSALVNAIWYGLSISGYL